MTLMSGNPIMFVVTLTSHLANWWFLEYVEVYGYYFSFFDTRLIPIRPHMQKLYGEKIRKESGVVKTIKKQLIKTAKPVKNVLKQQGVIQEVNKVLGEVNRLGFDVKQKVEKLVVENIADRFKGELDKVMETVKPRIDEVLAETKASLAETTARLGATLGM